MAPPKKRSIASREHRQTGVHGFANQCVPLKYGTREAIKKEAVPAGYELLNMNFIPHALPAACFQIANQVPAFEVEPQVPINLWDDESDAGYSDDEVIMDAAPDALEARFHILEFSQKQPVRRGIPMYHDHILMQYQPNSAGRRRGR